MEIPNLINWKKNLDMYFLTNKLDVNVTRKWRPLKEHGVYRHIK